MQKDKKLIYIIAGIVSALAAAATVAIYVKSKANREQKLICGLDDIDDIDADGCECSSTQEEPAHEDKTDEPSDDDMPADEGGNDE